MTEVTTLAPASATISKRELWALFVANPVRYYSPMGPTQEIYNPDLVLRGSDLGCNFDDYANFAADEIASDDDPADALKHQIRAFETFTEGLKKVLEDFERMAVAHVIYDEDDSDPDRYRYRRPVIVSGETA